ncbi:MAG: L,D-transpeptidase family protein [Caulobacteraceae bacterium]|nr:L,D-transpeptidase family protein [Caulobacteraceae bacterium]
MNRHHAAAALALLACAGCDDFRKGGGAPTGAAGGEAISTRPLPPAVSAQPVSAVAMQPPPADLAPTETPNTSPPSAGSSNPAAARIETASAPDTAASRGVSDLLIKVETLLDRAHFSPGVIDARRGGNLKTAAATYERAHGLAGDGEITPDLVAALTKADGAPVTQDYVVTAADEAGPFIGAAPTKLEDQAKLPALGYTSPRQELAARFHMSEALLAALNPGVDFSKAGATLLVVRPSGGLSGKVHKVVVDKAANQVRALDASGTVMAAFPATVGSTERPAPSGDFAVTTVAANPNYTYDPSRLTFGPTKAGKLTIPPGPNNPVGSTWIALTVPTYGIHGTPDPTLVGKTASHGCVRLTNWDAQALGKAVVKGTPVSFVGETTKS